MVAYGIGIILMIKLLKAEFPGVTHPWYADGAGALGTFANVELYFNLPKKSDQDIVITPNPLKSV